MKIIVFGATGTVGAEVVREGILDKDISEIIAVTRRDLDIKDPKLKVVKHEDYLDYSNISSVFVNSDACVWCLGVSQSQVNEDEYIKITYDYALAAAEALLSLNPNIIFLFLSGAGADQEEKASTLFGRIKGRTEKALKQLPFRRLYIVRPAGIQPIHLNKNTALVNKFVAPFYPLLKLFTPSLMITSVELAKAILHILKNGADKTVIDNLELKQKAVLKN